jgi:toxin ParE1/3/4
LLQVVIRPRAVADIEEVIDYYNQYATPETAERFLAEFRTARDLLAERPSIGSRRFAHLLKGGALRVWSLDRFPFRVFYIVEDETLQIIGVDHERRNVTRKSVL